MKKHHPMTRIFQIIFLGPSFNRCLRNKNFCIVKIYIFFGDFMSFFFFFKLVVCPKTFRLLIVDHTQCDQKPLLWFTRKKIYNYKNHVYILNTEDRVAYHFS